MACMAVGPHCFPGDSYAIHVQTKSLGGTGCLGKGVAEGEAEGAPPHFFRLIVCTKHVPSILKG